MARPVSELVNLLKGLEGVEAAYIQAPTTGMVYPCIMIDRSSSNVKHADNIKYLFKKGYTLIVVCRDPNSLVPDLVEGLPHSRFDRYYRANGLHHFAYQIFY